MIRPKDIQEAAVQAVLHAIRDGRRTSIWIDNRGGTPKYVVKANHNDEPVDMDWEFVAAIDPKTPPGQIEIEVEDDVQATFSGESVQ